jgi:hypothetical protein
MQIMLNIAVFVMKSRKVKKSKGRRVEEKKNKPQSSQRVHAKVVAKESQRSLRIFK